MKANKINIQLKNGKAVLREFEFSIEDWDLIQEAVNHYWIVADDLQHDMSEKGIVRLRDQAFYLKKDIEDIKDKMN